MQVMAEIWKNNKRDTDGKSWLYIPIFVLGRWGHQRTSWMGIAWLRRAQGYLFSFSAHTSLDASHTIAGAPHFGISPYLAHHPCHPSVPHWRSGHLSYLISSYWSNAWNMFRIEKKKLPIAWFSNESLVQVLKTARLSHCLFGTKDITTCGR